MASDKLIVFDTTLRDGAKGAALTVEGKLRIARQLDRLKVDVIEAGFPAAFPGDLEALKRLSGEIKTCTLAGLARALDYDTGIFRSGFSKDETYEMIKAEDINHK